MAPSGDFHFFELRYGQCDARQYYLSRSSRLQYLARTVAKNMLGSLRNMEGGMSLDDEEDEYVGDDSDEATDSELADTVTTIAWTDEVRQIFFQEAGVDGIIGEIADVVAQLSICDSESHARYLAYRDPAAKAFGEVAPAYAFLPATAFAEMDTLFPGARFIFILQDPVEQLCAQIRVTAEKVQRRGRREFDLNNEFRRALNRPETMERLNYQSTIRNLESVVPARRILYLFHEKMTSSHSGHDEVRRIESALGLAHREVDQGLFLDAADAPVLEFDRAHLAAARKMFSPVYRFVEDRFGEVPGWKTPRAFVRTKSGSGARRGVSQ